jgi:glycerol-3-phosphate dehydrogenase (NAD(P)+)
MEQIGILGSGSWGTALAAYLAAAGHPVALWSRDAGFARELDALRENRKYLPGVAFPEGLGATSNLEQLRQCRVVMVVVPSHGYREVLRKFLEVGSGGPDQVLISATKGVETETLARMSEVTEQEARRAGRKVGFAVISGPTFAAELAKGIPSAAVVASEQPGLARELRESLAAPTLRLYSSSDVVGVELGGAAKNVIAVGAGILRGLGLGHNTMAALITRGLHEITRLGLAFGGQARTFAGLAGLGDLVLTCTGGLSRNRKAGIELAKGKTLKEIQAGTSMVAEGIRNSLALSRLAERKGVEMPITEQMMAVIYQGRSPREALEELMARELKSETVL